MKLTLVEDEAVAWIGVYLDGKLAYEGPDIEYDHLLKLAGINFRHIWSNITGSGSTLPDDLFDKDGNINFEVYHA